MAATFGWQGADNAGSVFDIGGSGSNVNFSQSTDWTIAYTASPIPAGQSSIERHCRAKFSGSFNNITSVKFWRSDSNTLATGVTVRCGGLSDGNGVAFATPSTVANSDAAVPVTEGASNAVVNPDAAKDGSGNVYAPRLSSGNPRWLRLQVGTTGSTPAGDISSGSPMLQFTCKYTEN